MPLTSNASKNISELSRRCKTGGFGHIKGKSFKECHRIAIAAGLNSARRKKGQRQRKRR